LISGIAALRHAQLQLGIRNNRAHIPDRMGIRITPLLSILFSLAVARLAAGESNITVSSSAFHSGENIPAQFTCKAANVNPPLEFQNIPNGAKSLALIVDDPDAPGGLFTHWLVWNIAPAAGQIAEKSVPPGAVQGTNGFGKPGYGGPCPPSGTHRYFFRFIALDRMLDLKSGAKRAGFDKAIAGHVLARGELMGRFSH
jgi:Raf kinase inhibitor-like YbhB/YbcL family protein